jgi:hypothetical protein
MYFAALIAALTDKVVESKDGFTMHPNSLALQFGAT